MRARRWTPAGTVALATVLTIGGLAAHSPASAAPVDDTAAAKARLRADATTALTTDAAGGVLEFAGAARGSVENPGVDDDSSVSAAARAHLTRYGAAFGVDAGTDLVRTGSTRNVAGQDVVRYRQEIDGVPVLGGELAVSLRPDRQLASILAATSSATRSSAIAVTEAAAAATARAAVAKVAEGPFDLSGDGAWVIDPAVSGLTSVLGVRTAWRFEAGDGRGLRRMVLVDATNGRLLADQDLIAPLDRVVCDNANVGVEEPEPCVADFARVEGQPATGQPDVDDAYDLAGATSDFYGAIGGPDLTQLLGFAVNGTKKLASTVRFCTLDAQDPCPYENAFWNGDQMVFGEGFAKADDVVAHELTHGVTEKTANLFYWGQSGAINESMSDVMGEIVDRRHVTAADDPSDWSIGEDLDVGAARDIADPTRFGDPDRMTSDLWFADLGTQPYVDRGGVHLNSGVGNKTFFLVSQGGTFNGRTVAGLDVGDALLTRSAKLYLATLQSLLSGSDYADLGRVLVQTCDDFAAAATDGFTAADCQQVRTAVAATELDRTPTNAPQPADAPDTCPAGTSKRTLLDSESGTPATTFDAGALWTRAPQLVPPNATSGTDSWFGLDPLPSAGDPYASSLTARTPVTIPGGQRSYLHFQQWRVFEWDPASGLGWDGGTVELARATGAPVDVAGLPWVNGPDDVLVEDPSFPNPNAGRTAFGGDSFGWTASRLDLSSFAGSAVRPVFTVRGDQVGAVYGWYLDDIELYTCDLPRISNLAPPRVAPSARYPATLAVTSDRWSPASVRRAFQWLRNGAAIGGANGATYRLTPADVGRRISVRVTAAATGYVARAVTSNATAAVLPGLLVGVTPKIRGKAQVGRILKVSRGSWGSGVRLRQRWYRNGAAIRGATGTSYRLTRKDLRKRITVKVTGTKAGFTAKTRASRPTAKVRPRS